MSSCSPHVNGNPAFAERGLSALVRIRVLERDALFTPYGLVNVAEVPENLADSAPCPVVPRIVRLHLAPLLKGEKAPHLLREFAVAEGEQVGDVMCIERAFAHAVPHLLVRRALLAVLTPRWPFARLDSDEAPHSPRGI